MPLNEAMKELADGFRSRVGSSSLLSLKDMVGLFDYLKFNRVNLLKGTSDEYRDVEVSGLYASTASNTQMIADELRGKTLTYSLTVEMTNGTDMFIEIVQYDNNGNWLSSLHSQTIVSSNEAKMTVTKEILPNAHTVSFHAYVDGANGRTIKIKDERLYEGTEPGVWTPNPSDKVGGGN